MGRYDGEDYDYDRISICRAGEHQWAPNGTCYVCERTKEYFKRQAQGI